MSQTKTDRSDGDPDTHGAVVGIAESDREADFRIVLLKLEKSEKLLALPRYGVVFADEDKVGKEILADGEDPLRESKVRNGNVAIGRLGQFDEVEVGF